MKCLYAEVEELLPLVGIGELEIDGGIAVFPVAQIGGEDGECGLGVLSPGSDAIQCVDGEGMPQAVGCGSAKDRVSNDAPAAVETDVIQGLMECGIYAVLAQYSTLGCGQKPLAFLLKRHFDGQVIVEMLDDWGREGDEPVLSELCFFDIEGAVVFPVVVMFQAEGFRESHAALGEEKDGGVDGEIVKEVFRGVPDSSVDSREHALCL